MMEQIHYGLSVHSWPSGHAMDSEEAIAFTRMTGVNCMIEKFPLEKANEAIGKYPPNLIIECDF